MFQSFEAATRPDEGPPRLEALRSAMKEANIDAYLVPRADAHQGEYVSAHDDVLSWLTGFTGSAGFCAVTQDVAGVFIDGRYRLQVKAQVDLDHFTPVNWPETKLADWLKEHLDAGATVAFNPWLHTRAEIERLQKALTGIEVRAGGDLIAGIWPDRPDRPEAPLTAYPAELAGASAAEKCARIGDALKEAGQDYAILTLPDSICWLLNIRGSDIPRNPVAQGFAIVAADGAVRLYRRGGTAQVAGATVLPEAQLLGDVETLDGKVRCDPKSAPYIVAEALKDPDWADDPCLTPKACKTPTEIAATTEAHLRDGAAMVEFLAWFDAAAPAGTLTEIDVVKKLEGFRRATNVLKDISFETICGAGPNGAIVHYRVTEDTNRTIAPGDLVLVDSGGQYLDGTTDITRTITTGNPPQDQCEAFTRVLQGMIAVSRARWPRRLTGRDLDPLARAPLWMAGQDYDHGTGHGVGVFLSVHEGPQRLSRTSDVPLEPGMILSNEPGYYREGAWGIRIENLVVVEEAPKLIDDRDQLCFGTLTWAPIDTRLVVPEMLSGAERDWLNTYHAEVLSRIGPRVAPETRDWLTRATRAI